MVLARPRVRLTTKIGSKNSLYPLRHLTETPGERVQKTTVGEQFEPRIFESFYPATQENTGFTLQPFTHTQQLAGPKKSISKNNIGGLLCVSA
jgi:hypothetical protein